MSRAAVIGATAAGVLLLTTSCTKPRRPTVADAGHWVHSARLQEVMMDLQEASDESWANAAVEKDASLSEEAREAALGEACALAEALERSAERIPAAARSAHVPEADLRGFIAQAETLKDQARRLEQAGMRGDLGAMQEVLSDLATTCDTCHSRFRDLAGALPGH